MRAFIKTILIIQILFLCVVGFGCDAKNEQIPNNHSHFRESAPTLPLPDDNSSDDEPNLIEQYHNEEVEVFYEDIENEDIKTLIDNQTADFICKRRGTTISLTLRHEGMFYLDHKYLLTQEEIETVTGNDKYSMTYLAKPEFEGINAALFFNGEIEFIVENTPIEEPITDMHLYNSSERDERKKAYFIEASEFVVTGDYGYRYVVYENSILGKTVLYLIYNKGDIEDEWVRCSAWSVCENIPVCTVDEILDVKLLESAMSEQYDSFAWINYISNGHIRVEKYLNDGRTVTLFFDYVDLEESDNTCCARIEYNEISIFDILKVEHMPEKLLEQYAGK